VGGGGGEGNGVDGAAARLAQQGGGDGEGPAGVGDVVDERTGSRRT